MMTPASTHHSHHNGNSGGGGVAIDKVIVDPTKGGQVEAKERSSTQALALSVPEGTWVWAGAVSVLLVDLFRYVVFGVYLLFPIDIVLI